MTVADVYINIPVKSIRQEFTYLLPERLAQVAAGWRVFVPFGSVRKEYEADKRDKAQYEKFYTAGEITDELMDELVLEAVASTVLFLEISASRL